LVSLALEARFPLGTRVLWSSGPGCSVRATVVPRDQWTDESSDGRLIWLLADGAGQPEPVNPGIVRPLDLIERLGDLADPGSTTGRAAAAGDYWATEAARIRAGLSDPFPPGARVRVTPWDAVVGIVIAPHAKNLWFAARRVYLPVNRQWEGIVHDYTLDRISHL